MVRTRGVLKSTPKMPSVAKTLAKASAMAPMMTIERYLEDLAVKTCT
jgi:hypothetical protein